jgi:hypothetical protein
MRKAILFFTLGFALTTMILTTGCTKKVTDTPVANEDLTVVVGSVTAAGDTTIYLQTVVRPVNR